MEVISQLHASAVLPPRKELPIPLVYEAGWVPELVWTLWRREKISSVPLPGIGTRLSSFMVG